MKKRIAILITVIAAICVSVPFSFVAGAAEQESGVKMPVIMYHAVVPDKYSADAYTVRISDFIADLDNILECGYNTVLPRDLIAYARGEKDLPQKPIMLTFDDGFLGVKDLALPELTKRGQCAAVGIVGKYLRGEGERRVVYGYLSLPECEQMQQSGAIEIMSHSYNLHNLKPRKGAKRLWNESDASYTEFFRADEKKLSAELGKINVTPAAYAYPFGAFDKLSDSVLREIGYGVTFTCNEKINRVTRDENSLFGLGRYNRHGRKNGTVKKVLSAAEHS